MAVRILIVIAGLMGACGVILLAASAHGTPDQGLTSAGNLLLIHAAALPAGGALTDQWIARRIGMVALYGLALGAILFSGDIALRAFAGHRLFPMAAPTGGMVLIASWLLVSVAAILGRGRTR